MSKKKHKTPAQLKAEVLHKKQNYKPEEMTNETELQYRNWIVACHLLTTMARSKFDSFKRVLPEHMIATAPTAFQNAMFWLDAIDKSLFDGLIDRCSAETKAGFNEEFFLFEDMVDKYINSKNSPKSLDETTDQAKENTDKTNGIVISKTTLNQIILLLEKVVKIEYLPTDVKSANMVRVSKVITKQLKRKI